MPRPARSMRNKRWPTVDLANMLIAELRTPQLGRDPRSGVRSMCRTRPTPATAVTVATGTQPSSGRPDAESSRLRQSPQQRDEAHISWAEKRERSRTSAGRGTPTCPDLLHWCRRKAPTSLAPSDNLQSTKPVAMQAIRNITTIEPAPAPHRHKLTPEGD